MSQIFNTTMVECTSRDEEMITNYNRIDYENGTVHESWINSKGEHVVNSK